jgi:transcriptional regulator with XRE-family HTH domain
VAKELGGRLCGARKSRGLGLNETARVLKVSKSYLAHVEAGRYLPGMEYLLRLCKLYGAKASEIVYGLEVLAPAAVPDDPRQPLLPGIEVSQMGQ